MKPKLFFGLMLAFLWGCSEGDKPIQPQEVSDNSSIEFIEPEPDSVIVNSYELNRVVKHFMASADIKPTLSRSRPTEAIVNGAGNIQAYVTNFGNNQGYVVVSATKDYLPIIAWSKTDNFEVANMPEPVKEWFTDLDEAISSKDNKKNRKKYHEFWRQFEKVHQPKI